MTFWQRVKYIINDNLGGIVLALIVGGILTLIVIGIANDNTQAAACEKKGGVLLNTVGRRRCIKVEVIP